MFNNRVIFCTLIISLLKFYVLEGYAMEKSNTVFIDKEQLNLKKPEEDLEKNIFVKNMRFMRVCGLVCWYPGISADDVPIAERHGNMTVSGPGSDVVEEEVIEYAKIYNEKLLRTNSESILFPVETLRKPLVI